MLSAALVITSINRPNNVLRKYSELSKHDVEFYIVGIKNPKILGLNSNF